MPNTLAAATEAELNADVAQVNAAGPGPCQIDIPQNITQNAMSTLNGNAVLTDGAGDTLTFNGVTTSALTAGRLGLT